MRLLLDTHAFMWLDSNSAQLSPRAYSLIMDKQNEVVLSVVSVWEIAIKAQIGKLTLRAPLAAVTSEQIRKNQLRLLPVELGHVLAVETLPLYHRDPFDRLLVAQAIAENAALLSCDAVLDSYPVTRVW